MNTLLPMGMSVARQVASRLLSIVWSATDDESVERVAPVARQRRLKPVSPNELTVDQLHTVTFGLDGTSYQIELTAGRAAALRADLATWVSHARRTSGSTATRGTRRRTTGPTTATTIRRWARANGHNVSDRGRLPVAVRQAYHAAH